LHQVLDCDITVSQAKWQTAIKGSLTISLLLHVGGQAGRRNGIFAKRTHLWPVFTGEVKMG
jgi:hypothetical protein